MLSSSSSVRPAWGTFKICRSVVGGLEDLKSLPYKFHNLGFSLNPLTHIVLHIGDSISPSFHNGKNMEKRRASITKHHPIKP